MEKFAICISDTQRLTVNGYSKKYVQWRGAASAAPFVYVLVICNVEKNFPSKCSNLPKCIDFLTDICYNCDISQIRYKKGVVRLFKEIIRRKHRSSGYNEREIIVMKAAIKLYLEKGYSTTTIKHIADEANLQTGNVTYYFRTKEDILYLLIEELMEFHSAIIEKVHEETQDTLFAYAAEIAMQIALCNENEVARDLYTSAYTIDGVLALIKDWGYKKNMALFKDQLPDWTEQDFRNLEKFTSYIELAAIKAECERGFALEDKISLTLRSLLSLYEVPKEKQNEVIEKILASDYKKYAQDTFKQFIDRFEKSAEEFNK